MSISDGCSKLIPILQNYPCLSIEDDDKMDQRRRKAIFPTAMIHACAFGSDSRMRIWHQKYDVSVIYF